MNAKQQNFKSQQVIVEQTLIVNADAGSVFPLLCPTREYDWIDTWKCDLISSGSGYAEDLCVFQTNFPVFGHETWVCTTYKPDSDIVYVRFGAGWVIRLTLQLLESENTQSKWKMQFAFVSTNQQGNTLIASQLENQIKQTWTELNKMLNYYVKTGNCMKVES